LSVSVFKDKTSQEITIAFRGTELSGPDIQSDLTLFFEGAAFDQIIALYNWWMRESATGAQPVTQYTTGLYDVNFENLPQGAVELYRFNTFNGTDGTVTTGVYLLESTPFQSEGEGQAVALSFSQFKNIVGHSLGGHLAMAFEQLFGNSSNQVQVFNAPGFNTSEPGVAALFQTLGGEVPTSSNGQNVSELIATGIGNGDPGWSATANLFSEINPIGTEQLLRIENQGAIVLTGVSTDEPSPFDSGNHSQQALVDSLSVFHLLAGLDTTLTIESYEAIFEVSTNIEHASLERVVDALAVFFSLESATLIPGNDNRKTLYEKIQLIDKSQEYIDASSQGLTVRAAAASSNLGTQSQSDFSAFLTVHLLLPFAFAADEGLLSQLHPELYMEWSDGAFSNK
jgi:hypothetical protein